MELTQADPNEPGQYYRFRIPLPENQYYAVKPRFRPPHAARPVYWLQEGDKIEYIHKEYTLHVVVREQDCTITHFHISV